MIIVDTSVVLAALNQADASHQRVVDWYQATDPEFVTTPLVVAELDYLSAQLGVAAQGAWRDNLADGVYRLEWWDTAAAESVGIARKYDSAFVGLADASLVALADRLNIGEIATLDERHFRLMTQVSGQPFRLLPADANQ